MQYHYNEPLRHTYEEETEHINKLLSQWNYLELMNIYLPRTEHSSISNCDILQKLYEHNIYVELEQQHISDEEIEENECPPYCQWIVDPDTYRRLQEFKQGKFLFYYCEDLNLYIVATYVLN